MGTQTTVIPDPCGLIVPGTSEELVVINIPVVNTPYRVVGRVVIGGPAPVDPESVTLYLSTGPALNPASSFKVAVSGLGADVDVQFSGIITAGVDTFLGYYATYTGTAASIGIELHNMQLTIEKLYG